MRHFILTRFSIVFPQWRESRLLVNDERRRWFKYRTDMFRQTLLKSVEIQTRPVEKLILLMDQGDRDLYRSYLEGVSAFIQPVFTRLNEMGSEIDKCLLANKNCSISVSRVDSDDILACDYIEHKFATYKNVRAKKRCVHIVANHGFRSDLRYIQRIVDAKSPFISVFYDHFPGRLNLGGNHLEVMRLDPLFCPDANWLQLLHDSNVGNIFAEEKIVRINGFNWPQSIYRPDLRLVEGYVLNNERTRSLKRRLYALVLRTQFGVWLVKQLKGVF